MALQYYNTRCVHVLAALASWTRPTTRRCRAPTSGPKRLVVLHRSSQHDSKVRGRGAGRPASRSQHSGLGEGVMCPTVTGTPPHPSSIVTTSSIGTARCVIIRGILSSLESPRRGQARRTNEHTHQAQERIGVGARRRRDRWHSQSEMQRTTPRDRARVHDGAPLPRDERE